MRIFVVNLFLLYAYSLACYAKSTKLHQEKSVVPDVYLNVINQSDSMTFILIDPWSESLEDWMDGYGEVLDSRSCSNMGLKSDCYNVFSNPVAFELHDVVKNCTFMPDVAIVFHAKKECLIVAYSFYCDICRFAKNDKYVDFDGDLVRSKFLDLVLKIYPKDRYMRYLFKKSKSEFK